MYSNKIYSIHNDIYTAHNHYKSTTTNPKAIEPPPSPFPQGPIQALANTFHKNLSFILWLTWSNRPFQNQVGQGETKNLGGIGELPWFT